MWYNDTYTKKGGKSMLLVSALNGLLGLVWFVLVVYSLYILLTGKKPKNLNKILWLILILILPYLGVILYWIFEKKILG